MEKVIVSIAKCEKIDDVHSQAIKKTVSESLDLIGGLETIICRGDAVLIKPNLVTARSYKSGAVTNPYVVEAVCELARDAGGRRIIIADGSAVGSRTDEAFLASGIRKVAEKTRAELVDLKKAETVPMSIPNGLKIKRIKIPRVVMEADIIINVPVMKTHDVFPATLGLKNMKGVLRENDKKRFHTWGLAQCIVDLNKLLLPSLTILDGTVGMEGLGPTRGDPVNLGLIISSFDTVAADTVAALVMGIEPEEIEYIKLASQQGLGCADLSQIEIRGRKIDEVRRPFKQVKLEEEEYTKKGIKIYERGACSGCRHVMERFIASLEERGKLYLLKPYTIMFGQTVTLPTTYEGKLIKFGSCTKKYRGKDDYIPGCPPHPEDVLAFFEKKYRLDKTLLSK